MMLKFNRWDWRETPLRVTQYLEGLFSLAHGRDGLAAITGPGEQAPGLPPQSGARAFNPASGVEK
jgi:hypothetical protein